MEEKRNNWKRKGKHIERDMKARVYKFFYELNLHQTKFRKTANFLIPEAFR